MIDRSQLVRGILEGCIMKLIEKKETYGYEIITNLEEAGFKDIKEGTIYPILIRLEKKGAIRAVFKESPLGPKRKYYTMSDIGRDFLNDFNKEWTELKCIVSTVFEGGGEYV